MKKNIFLLCLFISFPIYADNTLSQSRYFLKNYGMAYCLKKFGQNNWIKQDAGAAESAYFQSGKHHGKAYQEVRSYIDNEFPKMKITDSNGNELIFYRCLEFYNSKKYHRFIRKLDKYYEY